MCSSSDLHLIECMEMRAFAQSSWIAGLSIF